MLCLCIFHTPRSECVWHYKHTELVRTKAFQVSNEYTRVYEPTIITIRRQISKIR